MTATASGMMRKIPSSKPIPAVRLARRQLAAAKSTADMELSGICDLPSNCRPSAARFAHENHRDLFERTSRFQRGSCFSAQPGHLRGDQGIVD
jgi:hypothetical protein